jgi:hypothetical protein
MTTCLAVWGAILSTFLAVWTIYRDIRDRGNLRVEAYLSEWDERGEEANELHRKYEVEIILTNIGRRPIFVSDIGVGNQHGLWLYLWRRLPPRIRLHLSPPKKFYEAILRVDGLPARLESGQNVSLKRENLTFLDGRESVLFALDTLGRYYTLPKAAWNRMVRNYNPIIPRESTVDHLIGKVRY